MKPTLLTLLTLTLLTLTLVACQLTPSSAAPAPKGAPLEHEARVRVTYAPSSENFANPERGFYQQEAPMWLGNERIPLEPQALSRLRSQGVSTLRLYFLIDEFRDQALSEGALEYIRGELAKVWAAGLKAIPRFAYNFPQGGSYPYRDPDAPLGQVLAHISQLEPLWRDNADVIAFVETGFVGAWGEWHSSTHALVDPEPSAQVNAASRAIVNRLLEALPKERMVAMRYPRYKQQLLGKAPLEPLEAYSGSFRARMGAHNDCFLASDTDWGTYPDDPAARAALKGYLALDNRFVAQGGETCNAALDAQPYIGCANARLELARMNYSALNRGYLEEVYTRWNKEGCLSEIRRHLGYRFRLLEVALPVSARKGTALQVSLKLSNDGYARPYNPRKFELVLRNKASRAVTRLEVKPVVDVRLFLPGPAETKTLELKVVLPVSLKAGTYNVLLNLPDPTASLGGKAAYSVRLANAGVWEEATGFNALNAALEVK